MKSETSSRDVETIAHSGKDMWNVEYLFLADRSENLYSYD